MSAPRQGFTAPTTKDNLYESALASSRSEIRDRIESWLHTPAVLVDRHLDVIAANRLAATLSESFRHGVNLARFAFLDPNVTRSEACWDDTAQQLAAMLRDSLDQHKPDIAFLSIVGELAATSWDFSDAWAETQQANESGSATFLDTPVGDVSLEYRLTRVPQNLDDTLILFRTVDDRSRELLDQLVSIRQAARPSGL